MTSDSSSVLRRSLRFRLAVTFALFGALLSLLLSTGVFVAAHGQTERLIDETLRAELEDFMARRARNPASLPPATVGIRGYVHVPGQAADGVPPQLADLAAGRYQLSIEGVPHRVVVADRGRERYVMVFDERSQRSRERQFAGWLAAGAVGMIVLSAAAGRWLAARAVAPIAELARRIGAAGSGHETAEAAFPDDEIGRLATGVFGGYLRRMRGFIDRERAFTADVSHELRTPLTIVQGVAELLQEDPRLDTRQQEQVARIRRAVDDMTQVTSALLIMAREDTLRESGPCDVCEVVQETVDAHRHMVRAETTVDLRYRSRPRLNADRTLLKIVVANLIRNAFAHTAAGRVSIQVEEGSLTVSDTGEGIRSEEIAKVFEKHFRGQGSTGSGIGLSLVKRICDRYGWEAVLESAVGQGTSAQLIYVESASSARGS
jgi:signal transduction histidine kinase